MIDPSKLKETKEMWETIFLDLVQVCIDDENTLLRVANRIDLITDAASKIADHVISAIETRWPNELFEPEEFLEEAEEKTNESTQE